ncbi:MAG: sulfite exporter TauE/SafE family protein [Desulfobacterales bacterium]|nr:sulfite exporter TauE/SafE family protein [Deltaproteobacteria bacterium]NNL77140.1 sulfite exporter TauE/SafE family protein [Desulfobacterales bacterium]
MEFLKFTFPLSGVSTIIFFPPLVAFGISFFTSMGGISGAFLLLPFQMSVLGFISPSVTSTNFLFNVIGTPGGVYRYAKECRFVWPIAILIVVGIIPGVLIGYYLRITYLPDPKMFKFFVGCVLLLISFKLFKEALNTRPTAIQNSCSLNDKVQEASIGMKTTRFLFTGTTYSFLTVKLLSLALAVGIISGVYGIGGGSIIAPFLITVFRLPVYAIAGAVLLGTLVSSLAGVAFYSLIPINGAVATPDWLLGILFGAGGLAGMYLGARVQKYAPEKWIKLMLGSVIIIVASKYIWQFISF